MTSATEKPKRPSLITLVSVFGIYTGLLSFYFIFRDGIQELALGNTLIFALGGIVFLVCGVGFWLMKKWAVYTYAVFAVINQVALLVMERWNIFSLLISAIIVYVGYKHLAKMS